MTRSTPSENRNKTHCVRGHPLSGANLRVRIGWRECLACKRVAMRKYQDENPDYRGDWRKKQKAVGKIKKGYTASVVKNTDRDMLRHALEAIKETRMRSAGADIIGKWRFKAILSFEPKLLLRVQKLTKGGPRHRKMLIASPSIVTNVDTRQDDLRGHRLLERVNAAVPRHLSKDMRDDIASDMIAAVLAGELLHRDIEARAQEFVRASFKADHNPWGPTVAFIDRFEEFIPETQALWTP